MISNGSLNGNSRQFPDGDNLRGLVSFLNDRVETYLGQLEAIGAPPPTLKEPFPDRINDDLAQITKLEIVRACERTMALVLGPMEWFMFQNMSFVDPACVSVMLELGIPEAIEPGINPTSLDDLVKKTGASKDVLMRIMRVCTQRLCFEEIAPGQFVHNGVSLTLLAPPINSLVGHCCDDGLRSAAHMAQSLRESNFQGSNDPAECAFSKAFGTKKGLFDYYYSDDLFRAQRFGLGMAGTEIIKALTEDVFPFETLPKNAKVVDVGGGRGHVSVRIAEKMPGMSFVVQDEKLILEAGRDEGIPEEVKERVEFMPHDFFQPQPVKGADVYLFRFILHDHTDMNCIKILSQIIDAMDPEKSRILIDDAVVPEVLGQESLRIFNLLDIYMMMILNAKERSESQWSEVFEAVNERLMLEKIWREPGGGPQGGCVLELRLRKG
ncbi:putative O-methyltransferase [Bisporella sp. PMI_857]|nr:putative O-methyltransferase [Bisporella sp. PMI_857]